MIFRHRIFSWPFLWCFELLNPATLKYIILGTLFILGIQGPWITQTLESTNFSFTRFQERSSIKCNYWLIVMHRYLTYTDFFAYCCYTWLFTRNDTNRTLYLMLKLRTNGYYIHIYVYFNLPTLKFTNIS